MVWQPCSRFRATICRERDNPELVDALYRLRKIIFVDTHGWDLQVVEGRECDQFDTDNAVHCALFRDDELIGGFRATRTDYDYLARIVFPQLAAVKNYPQRPDVWEISRFGVLPCDDRLETAKLNYSLMFRFAQLRRATALVALADLTYERFLRTLGIRTRRYGPPQVIGTSKTGEPLWAVAGEIPLAEQSGSRFQALLAMAKQVEIEDETLVLGRIRVSA
jgi:N-acyl-L-homoserine lactone synthetase